MKLVDHPNKRFMAKFNRYEPYLQDHTATQYLRECDRKYFYRIVLGRDVVKQTYQTVLDWGSKYHKFREVLQKTNGDLQAAMSQALAMPLTVPEIGTPAYKFAYLNQERFMRSIALAYQHWETDQEQKKIQVISVEEPINVELPDGSFTSGRPDQMVMWNGALWVLDYKTTSKEKAYFQNERNPNDQTTRYIYMPSKLHSKPIGGIIYDVLFNINEPENPRASTKKKSYGPEIYRHIETRTPKELQEWEDGAIHLNKQLNLNRELDQWPKRESKQCSFCNYKFVCRKSNELAQMAELESSFVVRPWDHSNVNQEVLADT